MERPQALGPVEVGCVKDAVVIIPIEGFGLKHNLSEKVPSEIGETILDQTQQARAVLVRDWQVRVRPYGVIQAWLVSNRLSPSVWKKRRRRPLWVQPIRRKLFECYCSASVCCNGDWREAVVSYRRELKATTKMFLPRSRGRFEGSWVHDVIGSLKLTQDCWCSPSGFSPMGRVNADLGEKSPPHRRAEVYK